MGFLGGLFGGKSKGPDYSGAIAAQNKGTSQAVDALNQAKNYLPNNFKSSNAFGSTSGVYDPRTKTVSSSTSANPLLNELFNKSLGKINNFDDYINPRVKKYLDVNRKSNVDSIASVLGNIYGQTGGAGRTNSTFNDAYGSYAAKAADNLAKAELDAENTIRGQGMGELQTQYSSALNPLQFLATEASNQGQQAAGTARGLADIQSNIANTYVGGGRSLASILENEANAKYQAKQQSKQALGNLIGTGLSLATKFIPMGGG